LRCSCAPILNSFFRVSASPTSRNHVIIPGLPVIMPKCGDIQCKDPSLPLLGLFLCALCEDELHMICGTRVQQDIKYHSVCTTCRVCVSHQNEVLRDQGMEEVPLLQVVQRRNTHRLQQHHGGTTEVTKAARVPGPTMMAAQVPCLMTMAATVHDNTSLASHVRGRKSPNTIQTAVVRGRKSPNTIETEGVRGRKSPNTIETQGHVSNRNKATGVARGAAQGTSSTSQPAAGRGKSPSPTAIILSETTEVTNATLVPGPTTMAAPVPCVMTNASLASHVRGRKSPNEMETEGHVSNRSKATGVARGTAQGTSSTSQPAAGRGKSPSPTAITMMAAQVPAPTSHTSGRKSPNTNETEGPLSNRKKGTVARGSSSQACTKRVGVALHNEKAKATRTTVMDQFLYKCVGCSQSTSDAYRCKFCNAAVHIFCSIEPKELGHGAHYTCPRCHDAEGREADEDLSELPAKSSGDTDGVVTVLPSAIARNRLGRRK
jgi:hypothetical protein